MCFIIPFILIHVLFHQIFFQRKVGSNSHLLLNALLRLHHRTTVHIKQYAQSGIAHPCMNQVAYPHILTGELWASHQFPNNVAIQAIDDGIELVPFVLGFNQPITRFALQLIQQIKSLML